MPDIYRSHTSIPRGVANRRAAIHWIRQNGRKPGVLYFGDDDNTFDLKLFTEIRHTKRVSMFPVGLIGLYAVSSPVVKNVRGNLDSVRNLNNEQNIHNKTYYYYFYLFRVE